MSQRNTLIRSLHDLGLGAWFGGALAGTVGFNGAAADVPDPAQRLRVASAGWSRWTPVNAAAIGAHLIGGAGLLYANKGRVATQRGVGVSTAAKAGLTGAALAATAYSGVLGRTVAQADRAPAESGTTPAPGTPREVAEAQRRLKVVQWVIPALTGALTVLNAVAGEQQRPGQALKGVLTDPGRVARSVVRAAA